MYILVMTMNSLISLQQIKRSWSTSRCLGANGVEKIIEAQLQEMRTAVAGAVTAFLPSAPLPPPSLPGRPVGGGWRSTQREGMEAVALDHNPL